LGGLNSTDTRRIRRSGAAAVFTGSGDLGHSRVVGGADIDSVDPADHHRRIWLVIVPEAVQALPRASRWRSALGGRRQPPRGSARALSVCRRFPRTHAASLRTLLTAPPS